MIFYDFLEIIGATLAQFFVVAVVCVVERAPKISLI